MLVCITAQGDSLDSQVDPRFGRCSYFIFYGTETKKYEAVPNRWKEAMANIEVIQASGKVSEVINKYL